MASELRAKWAALTAFQKASVVFTLVFTAAVVRWLCLARISHDEAGFMGIFHIFAETHIFQSYYHGFWGNPAHSSMGPTMGLPLGLLAKLFELPPVFIRLYVFSWFLALYLIALRWIGLRWIEAVCTLGFFLVWVACMPWGPAMNPAGLSLLGKPFAEVFGLCFALLANIAASRDEPKWRNATWVFAALAVGSKQVALFGITFPVMLVIYRGIKGRSLREGGALGFAAALGLLVFWELWQLIAAGGWDQFVKDWQSYIFWIQIGGGYRTDTGITFFSKFDQLAHSSVEPMVVLFLFCFGAIVLFWSRGEGYLPGSLMRNLACSVSVHLGWFLFLASRGWMRHLWIAYALLGTMVAMTAARLISTGRKPLLTGATSVFLVLIAVAFAHGRLGEYIGPLDEASRWEPQEAVALEIKRNNPSARLFVMDWHTVYTVPLFLKQPMYNLLEHKINPGDVIMCDEESDCNPGYYVNFCTPKITLPSRIGYCVYNPIPN